MYSSGLSARQAAAEHVLAVSRDFLSQPRLSKFFFFFLQNFANLENFDYKFEILSYSELNSEELLKDCQY